MNISAPQGWNINFDEQLSLFKTQPAHDKRREPAQVKKCDPGWKAKDSICERSSQEVKSTPGKQHTSTTRIHREKSRILTELGFQSSPPFSNRDYENLERGLQDKSLHPAARRSLAICALFLDGEKSLVTGIEYDRRTGKAHSFREQDNRIGAASAEEMRAILANPAFEDLSKFKQTAVESVAENNILAGQFQKLTFTQQEQIIREIWKKLPTNVQKAFYKRGSPGRNDGQVFSGYKIGRNNTYILDKDGDPKAKYLPATEFKENLEAQTARGLEVLRLYLVQGASCGIRGDGQILLPIGEWTIDHINPTAAGKEWDNPKNWIGVRAGLNYKKGIKPMPSMLDWAREQDKKARQISEEVYDKAVQQEFIEKVRESKQAAAVVDDFMVSLTSHIQDLEGDYTRDTSTFLEKLGIDPKTKDPKEQKKKSLVIGNIDKKFRIAHWGGPTLSLVDGKPSESSRKSVKKILWPGITSRMQSGENLQKIARDIEVIKYYSHYVMFKDFSNSDKPSYYLAKARRLLQDPTLSPTQLEQAAKQIIQKHFSYMSHSDLLELSKYNPPKK